MSVTEFRRTYFGTVLGYVWSLVRPLILFAVLLFVFTKIFRVGSDVPNYPVLLLLSIVLFRFFQEATTNAVTSVVAQEGVVRKTQFPRLVIPLTVVAHRALQPLPQPDRRLRLHPRLRRRPDVDLAAVPGRAAGPVRLTTAVSMLLSVLYVRFRDVAIIWTVVAQVLFYATPVLYPIDDRPREATGDSCS